MGWMAPLRHLRAKMLAGLRPAANREPSMGEIAISNGVFDATGVRLRFIAYTPSKVKAAMVGS